MRRVLGGLFRGCDDVKMACAVGTGERKLRIVHADELPHTAVVRLTCERLCLYRDRPPRALLGFLVVAHVVCEPGQVVERGAKAR